MRAASAIRSFPRRPSGTADRPLQARGRRIAAAGILAVGMLAAPSSASLGGRYATVEADRAHFAAAMTSQAMATHRRHTLTSASQGTVRELTLADGTVFAVAWRGPARPDLRQLLGPSFDAFQADTAARVRRHVRAPVTSRSDDLVVESAGRPGAFWGIAYLPRLVPAGFVADDLQP